MSFVLVLWDDELSSSVVNKKEVIGNPDIGQKRFVKWHTKQIRARIIRTGTKTVLSKIILSEDGEEWDETRGPECRRVRDRQTILDERKRKAVQYRSAASALKDHFLYNLTFEAAEERGVAEENEDDNNNELQEIDFSGCATFEAMIQKLPSPLTKVSISQLLKHLPCTSPNNKNNPALMKMCDKYSVYVNATNAWGYGRALSNEPLQFFEHIFTECVPMIILALPFMSSGGTKGLVGIPKSIITATCFLTNTKCSIPLTRSAASKKVTNLIDKARKNTEIRKTVSDLLAARNQ